MLIMGSPVRGRVIDEETHLIQVPQELDVAARHRVRARLDVHTRPRHIVERVAVPVHIGSDTQGAREERVFAASRAFDGRGARRGRHRPQGARSRPHVRGPQLREAVGSEEIDIEPGSQLFVELGNRHLPAHDFVAKTLAAALGRASNALHQAHAPASIGKNG